MSQERHLYFYHGTCAANAAKIRKEGFRSGYLTQCPDQAAYYSEEAYEADGAQGNEGVVVTVKVPVSGLRADFPSIEEPLTMILKKHDLSSEEDFHCALDQDKFGWPDGESDWQRGIFLTDSVYFEGNDSLIGEVVSDEVEIGFSDFDKEHPPLEYND